MSDVVLGTFSYKGNFSLKRLTPTIRDKKVTYSYSSLKLQEKICHSINTTEKLREGSCMSCGKDTERYHKTIQNYDIAFCSYVFIFLLSLALNILNSGCKGADVSSIAVHVFLNSSENYALYLDKV